MLLLSQWKHAGLCACTMLLLSKKDGGSLPSVLCVLCVCLLRRLHLWAAFSWRLPCLPQEAASIGCILLEVYLVFPWRLPCWLHSPGGFLDLGPGCWSGYLVPFAPWRCTLLFSMPAASSLVGNGIQENHVGFSLLLLDFVAHNIFVFVLVRTVFLRIFVACL